MKNKKIVLIVLLIIIALILTNYLSMKITKLYYEGQGDIDYQNLGLQIESHDIEYCTQYGYTNFSKYKVYKIKNYYSDSMDVFKEQLENNNLWSKNKFYKYIMAKFYEIKEDEIAIDELYYYHKKGVYAIFDIKNAKLHYFENGIFDNHSNYSEILDIKINNYIDREIYSVRGGPQNDGVDYYTYEFTEEKGNEIKKTLSKSKKWSREKLDDNILESFEYNEEVLFIKNGYYHYELVCRTSDKNKKYNFTKEEATGWEIGVYDIDKNILYYYWTSY